jgi:hypothetical protein
MIPLLDFAALRWRWELVHIRRSGRAEAARNSALLQEGAFMVYCRTGRWVQDLYERNSVSILSHQYNLFTVCSGASPAYGYVCERVLPWSVQERQRAI